MGTIHSIDCAMRSTRLLFIKSFVKHSVSLVSVTTWLLMINTCASNRDIPSSSEFTPVEYEDNDEYFIGIATGRSGDSTEAVLIAKTRALGELSSNIKVRILSVLKLEAFEERVGNDLIMRERFEEEITSISSATVRAPEYSTFMKVDRGMYIARVVVKKSKAEHIRESTRDLDLLETGELILELIKSTDQ